MYIMHLTLVLSSHLYSNSCCRVDCVYNAYLSFTYYVRVFVYIICLKLGVISVPYIAYYYISVWSIPRRHFQCPYVCVWSSCSLTILLLCVQEQSNKSSSVVLIDHGRTDHIV